MTMKQIHRLETQMEVTILKEGSSYIAYAPALDISTYGSTKSQARKNFEELVKIFFEEFLDDASSLEVVLGSLGWSKAHTGWQPPRVTLESININVPLAA
jgi:hypothetical protein